MCIFTSVRSPLPVPFLRPWACSRLHRLYTSGFSRLVVSTTVIRPSHQRGLSLLIFPPYRSQIFFRTHFACRASVDALCAWSKFVFDFAFSFYETPFFSRVFFLFVDPSSGKILDFFLRPLPIPFFSNRSPFPRFLKILCLSQLNL